MDALSGQGASVTFVNFRDTLGTGWPVDALSSRHPTHRHGMPFGATRPKPKSPHLVVDPTIGKTRHTELPRLVLLRVSPASLGHP